MATKTSKPVPSDVDAYLAAAPKAVQPLLRELRQVIKTAAPRAKEKISYGMPSYDQHGRVAYFAGFEGHVGLYGVAHIASANDATVTKYLENQSTLRFPVGQSLPVALIRKLIKARVKENEARRRSTPRER
ncbi:MAG TPA: DUF1801 domain-containing protein [Candidatus Nitrosopolaris sp.]|nr:DUF1801 domain-containing protein [Candidatus Nitrosopolaris sp.]